MKVLWSLTMTGGGRDTKRERGEEREREREGGREGGREGERMCLGTPIVQINHNSCAILQSDIDQRALVLERLGKSCAILLPSQF